MSFIETFNALWTKVISMIEQGYQTQALRDLTNGINIREDILDEMAAQGWTVHVGKTVPLSLVNNDFEEHGFFVFYSAEKEGHEKGSAAWYRDLCDVMGYPRDAIPDEVVRTRLENDSFKYH